MKILSIVAVHGLAAAQAASDEAAARPATGAGPSAPTGERTSMVAQSPSLGAGLGIGGGVGDATAAITAVALGFVAVQAAGRDESAPGTTSTTSTR